MKRAMLAGVWLILAASGGRAAQPVAHWDFNEGSGTTAKDVAGAKFPGVIRNAVYVKSPGGGYSLKFNGVDSWVDCGNVAAFNRKNDYTLSGWIKPQPQEGERGAFGQYMGGGYAVTVYRGGTWVYSGSVQTGVGAPTRVNEWNHVALVYSGKELLLFINGREAGRAEAKSPENDKFTNFRIGAISPAPELNPAIYRPFNGEIDDVKFFASALSTREIADEYNAAARAFGLPPAVTNAAPLAGETFTYRDGAAFSVNYAGVSDRGKDDVVALSLVRGGAAVKEQTFAATDPRYEAELEVSLPAEEGMAYTWKAEYRQAGKVTHTLEVPYTFSPAGTPLPGVSQVRAQDPVKWVCPTPDFSCRVTPSGGIELLVGNSVYRIGSSYSIPNSQDRSRFTVAEQPNWTVRVGPGGKDTQDVSGENGFYVVKRTIARERNRIRVRDRITNKTADLLGVMFSNFFDDVDPSYPVMADSTPTTWVSDGTTAAGMFAMDDVFMAQLEKRNYRGKLEMFSSHFGLEPKASYTIEWSVYPMASTGYLDFINTVRNDEFKPVTIAGAFGFVDQRNPVDKILSSEQARLKNLKYASLYSGQNAKDDGISDLEGFELVNFPKETRFLHDVIAALKKQHPGIQFQIHMAYTLFSSDGPHSQRTPALFGDSKALDRSGKQFIYGPDSFDYYKQYVPREWFDDGWRFNVYSAAKGGSFGRFCVEKGMPHLFDKVGVDAYYSDGCISGYVPGGYVFNHADGNSVEIDPATRVAKRRLGNSTLLGLWCVKEQYRMMNDRGGVVFTSDQTPPRSFWSQRYVACCETDGGDQQPISALYLSPGFSALGSRTMQRNPRDIYRDMHNKLSVSSPYSFYGDQDMLRYETIVMDMYPLTIEAIGPGTIFGRERILTTRSGTYEFPNRRDLHDVRTFDARGRRSLRRSVTTVAEGVPATRVDLGLGESAVIIPVPVELSGTGPVNVHVERYGEGGVDLVLNGAGTAALAVRNGEFRVADGQTYMVNGAGATARNGELRAPIRLDGLTRVTITR